MLSSRIEFWQENSNHSPCPLMPQGPSEGVSFFIRDLHGRSLCVRAAPYDPLDAILARYLPHRDTVYLVLRGRVLSCRCATVEAVGVQRDMTLELRGRIRGGGGLDVWEASEEGRVADVRRAVQHDPQLLHAVRDSLTPLLLACQNGHGEVVEFLLAEGAHLNQLSRDGYSAAYLAARHGHVHVVEMLLRITGMDPDAQDGCGRTMLFGAAYGGHEEVARLLLAKGAGLECVEQNGVTPLFFACQQGRPDVARLLLVHGAQVNRTRPKNGASPLFFACQQGHLDVVRVLIEKGAAINQARDDGATPLSIACQKGHVSVVSLLIEKGAEIQPSGTDIMPLYNACCKGHLPVVALLLDKGAELDKPSDEGFTPLYGACYGGHLDVVEVLLERGAEKDHVTCTGSTPLGVASSNGHIQIVDCLVFAGANPSLLKNEERLDLLSTYLRQPAETPEARRRVEHALSLNPPINARDGLGQTPAQWALQSLCSWKTRLITRAGGDVFVELEERRALRTRGPKTNLLEYASGESYQSWSLDTVFAPRSASTMHIYETINTADGLGRTPLHFACCDGKKDLVVQLLEHGADTTLVDVQGWLPLHDACAAGHAEIVQRLLEHDPTHTNVLAETGSGDTPETLALHRGRESIIKQGEAQGKGMLEHFWFRIWLSRQERYLPEGYREVLHLLRRHPRYTRRPKGFTMFLRSALLYFTTTLLLVGTLPVSIARSPSLGEIPVRLWEHATSWLSILLAFVCVIAPATTWAWLIPWLHEDSTGAYTVLAILIALPIAFQGTVVLLVWLERKRTRGRSLRFVALRDPADGSEEAMSHIRWIAPLDREKSFLGRVYWGNVVEMVFLVFEFVQLTALPFLPDISWSTALPVDEVLVRSLLDVAQSFGAVALSVALSGAAVVVWVFLVGYLTVSILGLTRNPNTDSKIIPRAPLSFYRDLPGADSLLELFTGALLMPITRTVFKTLDCSRASQTLDFDPSTQCWEGGHKTLATLALIFLVIYLPSSTVFGMFFLEPRDERADFRFLGVYEITIRFFHTIVVLVVTFWTDQSVIWDELRLAHLATFAVDLGLLLLTVWLRPCPRVNAVNVWRASFYAAAMWSVVCTMVSSFLEDRNHPLPPTLLFVGWSILALVVLVPWQRFTIRRVSEAPATKSSVEFVGVTHNA